MADTVKQWEDLAQGPSGTRTLGQTRSTLRSSHCLSWSHTWSVLLLHLTDKYKVY